MGFIVNENRGKRVLYVYNIQCCFRETNKLSVFLLNRPRPVAESTIPRGAHPHKSWPSRLYIYGWVYILYIYIEYYLARRREPPGWYIYICTIKLNERARFSPRSGNEVDTNVSFSICITIRSCVQCVLAFCAFRACLMYIRCRPLQSTICSRAAGGEGDRIGFERILHFRFLTKRAITLYLIRVNISHLRRWALYYVFIVRCCIH